MQDIDKKQKKEDSGQNETDSCFVLCLSTGYGQTKTTDSHYVLSHSQCKQLISVLFCGLNEGHGQMDKMDDNNNQKNNNPVLFCTVSQSQCRFRTQQNN